MITIENVDVYGWEPAIRGARNPMNSWDKSDSYWTYIENPETHNTAKFEFFMGENDEKLLRSLANAGPDHGKFLRMIVVYMDINAPLYWWKEYDTYKVGTVANSCSTMHKIHSKEFELDDFSHDHLFDGTEDGATWEEYNENPTTVLEYIIRVMNHFRNLFVLTKHKPYWWQMIQLLPTSYNQRRTVMVNYAVLRTMYHARKHHKLDEWRVFCRWVESLPHSYLITGEECRHADA
jgi:hypothetical protein